MRMFFEVFITISLIVIIKGFLKMVSKADKEQKGLVRLPAIFFIAGAFDAVVCLIFATITIYEKESAWVTILFLSFEIIGIFLIIAYINCRVFYNEDGFVSRNFFGFKKKASYKDITGMRKTVEDVYVFMGRKKIVISKISTGSYEFISFFSEKYKEEHNGKQVPIIKPSTKDIFNGNVSDPGSILVAYGFLVLIALVSVGLAIYVVHFDKDFVDNTIKHTVKFVSYEEELDGEIKLTTVNGDVYKISYTDEQFNIENIKEYCDGKTSLVTYSKEAKPRKSEDYYSIKAIMHNGEFILSFEDNDRLHKQEEKICIGIAIFACVLIASFIISSVIVARNPEKYSRKVVRLFFKDGYVNY